MKSFILTGIVRRSAFLLLFILIGASTVLAQGRRQMSPEQMTERYETQKKEMIASLELEGEQADQFSEIMDAAFADRMDMMEEMMAGGDRSGMREKMTALEESTQEALAEVLTEEQMDKYKEIVSSRRGRRGPASS